MAETRNEDRTLPASPRRLEKAREEGQVARSRDLGSFLATAAVLATLAAIGPTLFASAAALVRAGLRFDGLAAHHPERALERLAASSWDALGAFGPIFLALLAAGVLGPLLMGGWLWSTRALAPDFNRLDPVAGLGRILSGQAWKELAKAATKALLLGVLAAWMAWDAVPALSATARAAGGGGVTLAAHTLGHGLVVLLGGLAVLAAVDVPLALWEHHSRLRMTRQEARDEQRESEGDPQLKGRVRREQRAAARRRMMSAVPKAAVVVTNPTHYAVAIDWREGLRAPRVVAKGTGLVAERIKEIARAAGVPSVEAPALARALNRHVPLDGEVPAALYQAIAVVLAWVYQVRAARATGRAAPPAPTAVPVPRGYDPLDAGAA